MKKIVGQIAAIICLAAWFFAAASDNAFVNYPRVPSQPEGRIVPYLVKGVIVYITVEQRQLVLWTNWTFIGSGLACLLMMLLHGGDPFKPLGPRNRAPTSNRAIEGDSTLRVHARNIDIVSNLRKVIGVTAAAITLIMWAFYKHLDSLFARYPAAMKQENDRTIPHVVNGITIYITKEQQHIFSFLNWTMITSVLVLIIVMLIHEGNPFKRAKAGATPPF